MQPSVWCARLGLTLLRQLGLGELLEGLLSPGREEVPWSSATAHPQARRGYSRDHRPDCKQDNILLDPDV